MWESPGGSIRTTGGNRYSAHSLRKTLGSRGQITAENTVEKISEVRRAEQGVVPHLTDK